MLEQDKRPKKLPDTEKLDYGNFVCSVEQYDFWKGETNFSFPLQSETAQGVNPFHEFKGETNFVFPDWVCVEKRDEGVDLRTGSYIEPFGLEVPFTAIDLLAGSTLSITYIETPMSTDFYTGITVDAAFDAVFETDFWTGITVDQFQFTVTFDGANVYQGSVIEPFAMPIEIDKVDFYTGIAIPALELTVPWNVDFWTGSTLFELNTFGEINVGVGNSVWVDLFTGFGVPFECGHNVDAVLHYTEGGTSLGIANVYTGSCIQKQRNLSEVQDHILGYVDISISPNWFTAKFKGSTTTILDYINICCYEHRGVYGGGENYWEVGHEIDPNEVDEGLTGGVWVEPVDLVCTVNMFADVYTGHNVVFFEEEYTDFYNVDVFTGIGLDNTFDYLKIINLCGELDYLSGKNLSIDIYDPYDYNCSMLEFRTGSNLSVVDLSCGYSYTGQMYCGMNCFFDITLDRPWQVDVRTGTYLWKPEDWELEIDIPHGYILQGKFYEPFFDMYTGTGIDPLQLVAKYYVEFLEWGCLANEYIYTSEDGIRQDYKTIREAVEWLPYKHEIKARCF